MNDQPLSGLFADARALDCEAAINLKAHLDLVMRAFEARDYDGAIRKLGAATACVERVKSRSKR